MTCPVVPTLLPHWALNHVRIEVPTLQMAQLGLFNDA